MKTRYVSSLLLTTVLVASTLTHLNAGDPFARMRQLMQEMEDEFFKGFDTDLPFSRSDQFLRKIEENKLIIKETDKEFVCTVELPGFAHEEIKVQVQTDDQNNRKFLIINAKQESKKEEETKSPKGEVTSTRFESSKKSFSRTLQLPNYVNDSEITSEYKDGILTIRVPFDTKRKDRTLRNIDIKKGK